MSKPRNKMPQIQLARFEVLKQQEVPAHGGQPFIVEQDLRSLPAFKKGEVCRCLATNMLELISSWDFSQVSCQEL